MLETRIDTLIKKFHAKQITEEEHQELLQLLAENSNRDAAHSFFENAWNNFEVSASGNDLPQKFASLNLQTWQQTKRSRLQGYLKYAAVACIAIALLLGINSIRHKDQASKTSTVKVLKDLSPGKNLATITLPNRQKLIINDNSEGIINEDENIIIRKNNKNELTIEIKKQATNPRASNKLNTITTPKGGQFTVVLPDSSKVFLNAESTLKFPSIFANDKRNVSIEGEAFFEISKDKAKPFFVSVNDVTIQVLGTHFNVNAYNNDNTINTTLVEGAIKIAKGNTSKIMRPGQQALIDHTSDNINLSTVDIEQAIAWKNGYFLFVNQDLKSIMKSLSRWYNFEIKYDPTFKNVSFTGTISRTQNISEILKIFKSTETVNYQILSEKTQAAERRIIVMK